MEVITVLHVESKNTSNIKIASEYFFEFSANQILDNVKSIWTLIIHRYFHSQENIWY